MRVFFWGQIWQEDWGRMADRVKALAKQYQKRHPGPWGAPRGCHELPNRRWDNTARRRGYQTVAGTVPLKTLGPDVPPGPIGSRDRLIGAHIIGAGGRPRHAIDIVSHRRQHDTGVYGGTGRA